MSLRKALALAAATLLLAFGAAAQQQYQRLEPAQPTESAGKIEVVEFFWYRCPHCYALEPYLHAWVQKLPKDVVFKRVAAVPSEAWAPDAFLYYTLETMNLLDADFQKVFDAIHKDNVNFSNKKIRDAWLTKNGIDAAKFSEVEKSFSVDSKVKRANQLTNAYKVDGVPRIFVNGKWFTEPTFTGGPEKTMAVVDQIIDLERKSMAPALTPTAAPAKPAAAKTAPAPAKAAPTNK